MAAKKQTAKKPTPKPESATFVVVSHRLVGFDVGDTVTADELQGLGLSPTGLAAGGSIKPTTNTKE